MMLGQTDDVLNDFSATSVARARMQTALHRQTPNTRLVRGKQAVSMHKSDDYDQFWPSRLILAGEPTCSNQLPGQLLSQQSLQSGQLAAD
jgi:hypothetical protein